MNDIEVLEKRKDMLQARIVIAKDNPQTKKSYIEEMARERKAIENLLKERQSDKERIKELEEELEEKDMQHELELIGKEEYTKASMGEIIEQYYTANEDCIPKSLIKEKIEELNRKEKEELKGSKGQDRYFIKQMYQYQRKSLEELLKGE